MRIQVTYDDLKECFDFAVLYFTDDKKVKYNRTTGQNRGLGAILNDFLIGKLIEIGVARAIGIINSKKQCIPDFSIYNLTNEKAASADIETVVENGIKRKARLFTEIKNISLTDRWIGLTKEQMETIGKNSLVGNEAGKIYFIYAHLTSQSLKNIDPLGVFLKQHYYNGEMDKFADIADLGIEIIQIITCEELRDNGTEFLKGSYFYETEIVQPILPNELKRITNSKGIKTIRANGNIPFLPRQKSMKESVEIGDIIVKGSVNLLIKDNLKSRRVIIECLQDSVLSNKVLGEFELVKGNFYELHIDTVGRDPVLKRNNIWIARRNLHNVIKFSAEERLKEIAERI